MGNGGARSAVQMDVEIPEGLRELRGERAGCGALGAVENFGIAAGEHRF